MRDFYKNWGWTAQGIRTYDSNMECETLSTRSRVSIGAKALRNAEIIKRKYGNLSTYFHMLDTAAPHTQSVGRRRLPSLKRG
jgi:hypothetical protein